MLKFIKSFFKKQEAPVAEYKVEAPAPVVDVAPVPAGTPLVNDAGVVVAIADGKPAKVPKVKKEPAAKKAPAVKKPRAPRKPKAE